MSISGNTQQETLIAKVILSNRELDVAMLYRINMGRNGIAGILNLSENSIKTLMKRIEAKLGSNWQINPKIIWSQYQEEIPEAEQAATMDEPAYVKAERLKKEEKRIMKINVDYVTGNIKNYLDNTDWRIGKLEIHGQLDKVRRATSGEFKNRIPGISALAAMAIEDFNL